MIIRELIKDMEYEDLTGKIGHAQSLDKALDTKIGSIHYRAQEVQPGGLFVAVPGHVADGHDFIDQAVKNGAEAIVVQKPVQKDVITLRVENTRKALARLSARFYGKPSQDLFIVGITGTNGKTTTSYLIEKILSKAGLKTGVIGTINYRYNGIEYPNPVTTPESLDLQRILSQMKESGITHVIMEVSSHALALHRIDHCWIDVGIFTNLSQDHLDYHKDMESYWSCKKILFTEILNKGPKKGHTKAVINGDDPKGDELDRILTIPRITTGFSPNYMIWPDIKKNGLGGMAGNIMTPEGTFEFESPLVGSHNQQNILSAVGAGTALGLSIESIKAGIQDIHRIPGRLESIQNDTGRYVYVDYAHTPDALKNVLLSLKAVSRQKMICIFGCGGDRDKEKRPQMGEVAGKLCDISVITSDNPRSEQPEEIIRHILQGTKKTNKKEYETTDLIKRRIKNGYVVEPDRKKAIHLGISVADPGDTVLIAGKGHETYQILDSKTISFDDRQIADQALKMHEE